MVFDCFGRKAAAIYYLNSSPERLIAYLINSVLYTKYTETEWVGYLGTIDGSIWDLVMLEPCINKDEC